MANGKIKMRLGGAAFAPVAATANVSIQMPHLQAVMSLNRIKTLPLERIVWQQPKDRDYFYERMPGRDASIRRACLKRIDGHS